jgi:hypothetical protein
LKNYLLSDGLIVLSTNDEEGVNYAKVKLQELRDTENLAKLMKAVESKENNSNESSDDDKKKLTSLKMKAGKLKLPKEEWGEFTNVEEFEKYLDDNSKN